MTVLKIIWVLFMFGSIWFVGGPMIIIDWFSENTEQLIRLLILAALISVGLFALIFAWAFNSLRNRDKKGDWSWSKEGD